MGKPTETTSFKTLAVEQGLHTVEGVILHGFWKRKRRRGLSLPFNGERNPRKAHAFALSLHKLEVTGVKLREQFDQVYRERHGIE